MTTSSGADERAPTADDVGSPGPAWEFPEIAIVVSLIGVGLLAVGGLSTGIARSLEATGVLPPGLGRQYVGYSLQLGTTWASFLLAVVLLGLMGVCWWNLNEWEPELGEALSPEERDESQGHITRGCGIVIAIQIALVLTGVAAIAALVGAILEYPTGATIWSIDLNIGAETVAVLIVSTTGVLLGRRLVGRYSSGAPVD